MTPLQLTPLEVAVSKLSESEKKQYYNGKKIFKTDSHSRYILVDNPDRYSSSGNGSQLRKIRRKATNVTPKKKKRKKNK